MAVNLFDGWRGGIAVHGRWMGGYQRTRRLNIEYRALAPERTGTPGDRRTHGNDNVEYRRRCKRQNPFCTSLARPKPVLGLLLTRQTATVIQRIRDWFGWWVTGDDFTSNIRLYSHSVQVYVSRVAGGDDLLSILSLDHAISGVSSSSMHTFSTATDVAYSHQTAACRFRGPRFHENFPKYVQRMHRFQAQPST